jgi:Fe-S cluster assembly ATP-binding protein
MSDTREQIREDQILLECRGVHVYVEDKEIVKGVDLQVRAGQKAALMGPNGSGKSTFAAALMGHPAYRVEGEITLCGDDLTGLAPDERARRGLFLGFQYPVAVPGVTVASFLRAALSARLGRDVPVREFREQLFAAFDMLGVPKDFAGRYLNDGFSGGEKKRLEIMQMLLLQPRVALLDETDSGLDIDALKVVSAGINRAADPQTGVLIVTHYQRILAYIQPDVVHVFMDGRIVRSGGPSLALELEARGYDWLAEPVAASGSAAAKGKMS